MKRPSPAPVAPAPAVAAPAPVAPSSPAPVTAEADDDRAYAAFSAAARARFSTGTHETVSQTRLVVMCFDRIARDLGDAQAAIAKRDHFAAHSTLVHAQDIIVVLRDALDVSLWDGAAGLAAIYDWSLTELARANISKDAAVVARVASALADIGSAFTEASRMARQAAPAPGSDAPADASLSVRA